MNLVASGGRAVLTLLVGTCAAQAAESPEPRLVGMTSCSLEMAISQSPENYLIAIVEHTDDTRCGKGGCSETLTIVHVFAYRSASNTAVPDHIVAIQVMGLLPEGADSTSQHPPKGQREIGIYLPVPKDDRYYGSGVLTPVTSEIEAIYEKATQIATEAPTEKRDCNGLFTPASRVEGPPQRWMESSRVFAVIAHPDDSEIIAAADVALSPLHLHRETTGTRYPGGLMPGIFASYALGNLTKGLLVQASAPGCIVFSVSNYAQDSAGLSSAAVAAFKSHLTDHFGKDVKFYSDDKCLNAL
jgi:hypothetical protein